MKLTTREERIWLRDILLEEVAKEYGTPFYLYDLETINEKIHTIRSEFGGSLELFYAMKANPNAELLRYVRGKVDGLDIASGGELQRSLAAGYESSVLSFAGPGKTAKELLKSLQCGVGFISVESHRELLEIEKLVSEGAPKASVLIRVNPKLLIKEFAVKMGGRASHFGIDEEDLTSALDFIKSRPTVFNFRGIHVYAGTQCMSEDHLVQSLKNTLEIATCATIDHGMECNTINIGGGFGVSYYESHERLDIKRIAALYKNEFAHYRQKTHTAPRIILELGRYLVAEAGMYVARVVSEKRSRGEIFYILDGGMNHHLAASGNLGATIRKNYMVRNLTNACAPKKYCTLVGPLCTPMDVMGKEVSIETPRIGDLIGFMMSGSYGYSASPLLFLGHEPPAEILVASDGIRMTP